MGRISNDDEEIIRLLTEGKKKKAFQLTEDKYRGRVFARALRMLKDVEEAADATQVIFTRIWEHFGKFKGNAKLYTWIHTITTNVVIDMFHQRNRLSHVSLDNLPEDLVTENMPPDWEKVEMDIENMISRLPDRQQEVFRLRYYDEMPYAEMAEKFNLTEGALKASYHLAVKKIERMING